MDRVRERRSGAFAEREDGARPRPLLCRRRLEIALGALWLLDGLLQLQPYMFTRSFGRDVLGMAGMGLPGPLEWINSSLTGLIGANPAVWNCLFALTQLALGAGLLWRRTAWLARPASLAWALAVWVVGEGLGGLFMSGVSAVNGAPGAALLYAVLAALSMPGLNPSPGLTGRVSPVAGRLGPALWAALWWGTGLLELGAANHASALPGAELGAVGVGEPHIVASGNAAIGRLVTGHGMAFAVAVGLAHLVIGGLVLPGRTRRWGLLLGAVAGATYGLAGQDLGGLLTGHATDPGSGPLLVLFALALWPAAARRQAPAGARSAREPGPALGAAAPLGAAPSAGLA